MDLLLSARDTVGVHTGSPAGKCKVGQQSSGEKSSAKMHNIERGLFARRCVSGRDGPAADKFNRGKRQRSRNCGASISCSMYKLSCCGDKK